jgi:hypothetical protein
MTLTTIDGVFIRESFSAVTYVNNGPRLQFLGRTVGGCGAGSTAAAISSRKSNQHPAGGKKRACTE